MKHLLFLLFLAFAAGCISTQGTASPAPGSPGSPDVAAQQPQVNNPLLPVTNPQAPAQLILSNVSIDGCNQISGSVINNDNKTHDNVTVRISYGNGLSASTNYILSIPSGSSAPWALPLVYDPACYTSIDIVVTSIQGAYEISYPAPHCPSSCDNGGECSAATGWKCVNLAAEPLPYVVFVELNNSLGDDFFVSSVVLENPLNLSESYSTISQFVLSIGNTHEVQMTAARQLYVSKGAEKQFNLTVKYAPYNDREKVKISSGTVSIGRFTKQVNFTLSN